MKTVNGYDVLEGPRRVLSEDDDLYPPQLLEGAHRPGRLYVIGDPEALLAPSVAIVGARKATPYGIACAELSARVAVEMGVGVVSGAAIGCDQASQREALRRGGKVVAVLGSGANVVYPKSARGMLEGALRHGGAVVSLQPWDAPPVRWAFARRNAVIASLARLLIICEAGMPSGTFSTAQSATDAGREVLVFPGSVFSPNSTGSNYLIASDVNAMPIWDRKCLEIALSRNFGRDCNMVLHAEGAGRPGVYGLAEEGVDENRVLQALDAYPVAPGLLAMQLGMDTARLMRLLGRLEMRGCVSRLVDGRYSLTNDEYKAYGIGRLNDGASHG